MIDEKGPIDVSSVVDTRSGETLTLWLNDLGYIWRGDQGTVSPLFAEDDIEHPNTWHDLDHAFDWLDNLK